MLKQGSPFLLQKSVENIQIDRAILADQRWNQGSHRVSVNRIYKTCSFLFGAMHTSSSLKLHSYLKRRLNLVAFTSPHHPTLTLQALIEPRSSRLSKRNTLKHFAIILPSLLNPNNPERINLPREGRSDGSP